MFKIRSPDKVKDDSAFPVAFNKGLKLVKSADKNISVNDCSLIGNCQISCVITNTAQIIWSCMPRFDGDPIFCRYGFHLDVIDEYKLVY